MKKLESDEEDDLRPEYDFSQLKGGIRGKYVERYREGTNLVLLDPDVAAAFPDAQAVNAALRLLLREKQTPNSRSFSPKRKDWPVQEIFKSSSDYIDSGGSYSVALVRRQQTKSSAKGQRIAHRSGLASACQNGI